MKLFAIALSTLMFGAPALASQVDLVTGTSVTIEAQKSTLVTCGASSLDTTCRIVNGGGNRPFQVSLIQDGAQFGHTIESYVSLDNALIAVKSLKEAGLCK